MKHVILIIFFLYVASFTNAQDMQIQKKYVPDTTKIKKDSLLKNFEQKPDAFYIQQKSLEKQIYIQNFKLDSIINQKPNRKYKSIKKYYPNKQ